MARTFGTYKNGVDKSWYDSSNILFSEGTELDNGLINLIIVFNGGRKYVYKNVSLQDYLSFRESASQGKALREFIVVKDKGGRDKYECLRLADVDVSLIEEEKKDAMEKQMVLEKANGNSTCYTIIANSDTGMFKLYLADEVIYEGHVDHVSIFKLFKSMNVMADVHFVTTETEYPENEEELNNADSAV